MVCFSLPAWLTTSLRSFVVAATLSAGPLNCTCRALDAAPASSTIDRLIEQELFRQGRSPEPLCNDAEFVRRAYLDLTGVVPPAQDARSFLDDPTPDKRDTLIDRLLDSPAYARRMAGVWTNLLVHRTADNRKVRLEPLTAWLEKAFFEDVSWDQVVYALVTASGPQQVNPAVTPFMKNSQEMAPHEMVNVVARCFLGIDLRCAQCHDHPYAEWTHEQYWSLAAFFDGVDFAKKFHNVSRPADWFADQPRQPGSKYGIRESAAASRRRKRPERALTLPPRLLDGRRVSVSPSEPLRPALADWLASADNPWLVRGTVNRVWAQMFGRGLVEPAGDQRRGNPASHPELLDALGEYFVQEELRFKPLVRSICQSRAYQRTASSRGAVHDGQMWYSHRTIRPLDGRQLYDSLLSLLGEDALARSGSPAAQREHFIQFFKLGGYDEIAQADRGIPQALRLMNDRRLQRAIRQASARLTRDDRLPGFNIEQLYLATVTRLPERKETEDVLALVAQGGTTPDTAYAMLLWALINSSEFALNH